MLVCMQKINFITHFFLTKLQGNSKLAILANLGVGGHTYLKWWYQFEEIFEVYLQEKTTSFFTFSLRYCKDIAKLLFWVLWTCLATHIKSDTIKLLKTLMSMRKIKIIIHFFLEIWHYKESCNLIRRQNFPP